MAEWSHIANTQLVDFRWDSEYYGPYYLKKHDELKSAPVLSVQSFSDVTDGIHGSPEWVEKNGITYLSAKCVKDNHFVLSRAGQISIRQNAASPRTQARIDDVLLTTVGTIGNAAVVNEDIVPANMDRHLGIIRIRDTQEVDPYYLATYLNSEFGRFQTARESTGNVQLNLFIAKIKQLLVPIGPEYNALGQLTRQAYQLRRSAERTYAQAEALLQRELGLEDLDLSPQTNYIQTFQETRTTQRLDAEYYQPKYQKMMKLLGRAGRRIHHVARIAKRRFKPKAGETFEYIEIGDVSSDGQADSNPLMGESAPSRAQWIVRSNDVITSTVRPLRRLTAQITPDQDGYVCTSGFAVLQPHDIESEVLLAYLRLPVVCKILDLHTSAAMYPAISTTDLMNIPIALPSREIRQEIVAKVQASRQAIRDANSLLEEAKFRVEQLIVDASKGSR